MRESELSCDAACDCRKDREFCAAAEERNNSDRCDSLVLVGKRTSVDERGDGATEAMIIGMNALPDKPNLLKILSRMNATRAI